MNGMSIRREPAMFLALLAALLQVVSASVFPLSDEQQGVLNAAFAVLFGAITAAMVGMDKLLPLLGGVFQAVISVGTAFGLEMDPTLQSAIMAVIAAAVGMFVRTQVVAPVTAEGQFVMRDLNRAA